MTHSDTELLHKFREAARARRKAAPAPAPAIVGEPKTIGEKAADMVAATMGSWAFIVVQSVLLFIWVGWNAATNRPFDPYPFILLNLALSFQAAYSAPIIMMSQNRQSDIDRRRAIDDFDVNCKAELEIETLHQKIDLLREQEIARLAVAVDRLTEMLEKRI
ncbi:MAG TPA: DUF1003 domain-containing protein [Caulobacterales bacterium]|nr:DUF1003 domain-containing protein [Caulobacterales bacterium]